MFPTKEIFELFFGLLPGFVAAWIFYGLTPHPKKDQFDRTIQAFIFTGIVRAIVIPIQQLAYWIGRSGYCIGEWTRDGEYLLSNLLATLLGLFLASAANTNLFYDYGDEHQVIADPSERKNRFRDWISDWLTKKTFYPSEWFSALNRVRTFVTLHLDDGRRIYGWPEEFPDSPDSGHFLLMGAEWLTDHNSRLPISRNLRILVPAKKVVFIEQERRCRDDPTETTLQPVDTQSDTTRHRASKERSDSATKNQTSTAILSPGRKSKGKR
ncbi:DUF6338 family protein [Schlesneria sp. DSM 10557]|uniref:DUF6338 family protein n=1 Tax=Schlesneria sp. DSM 10557 TaxID=3044399 RepID=UPI0035A09E01